MRNHALVLIVLLAALATACSSVRANYDFDPNADFSAWQTYAWYPSGATSTEGIRAANPFLDERVVAAIDRSLGELGFRRVLEGEPDFYVNYHLSTEQRLDVRTMNSVYMGGPGGRHWGGRGWGGVAWTETRVEQYEEGTLVIDLIDTAARQLVWRGSGTRRLARNPGSDQVTRRVNEAVAEILGQFPPKQ